MKNFHCFWAYKRCNVNELLPGLHIWWKQLQHSLYTFCIPSVVCVYQWLPVCFEQTKILDGFWKWYIIVGNAFLVQQRNLKCISNTKKFVNDNLSSTNGYQNRISHFHCNLQVEIAAYFSSVPKRCKHCEYRGYIQRLIRFCKRRRIYLPIILHYSNLYFYIFVLSPISSADFYDFSKGKFP